MTGTLIDMAGRQIGTVRVLHYAGGTGRGAAWRCKCDKCGERFDARGDRLRKAQRVPLWRVHWCNEAKP